MIDFKTDGNLLHLSNDLVSYIMEIREGRLLHVYFGPKIRNWIPLSETRSYKRNYTTEHPGFLNPFDEIAFEYPQFGQGDFREDAFRLVCENNGMDFFDFRVDSFKLCDGLTVPDGLPGIHGSGKTLVITVLTPDQDLKLELFFGMNEEFSGIFRFQKLTSCSFSTYRILKLSSASLDLPADEWEVLSLAGTHLKEGTVQTFRPANGKTIFDSRRGSSSPHHPPFLALCRNRASWYENETIGLALLYSGNHAEIIEKDFYSQLRITAGLHPDTLNWTLNPYESFCTPQCVLCFSENGLNGMAQQFHSLYLNHLFPARQSPLLINSWESFYYNTTSENLLSLAEKASDAGLEMLVIDDGWFRKENSSRSPIGDWKLNTEKIPEGLAGIAEKIEAAGLQTGLWLEPEAVSAGSKLYQEHPDWVLHYPGMVRTEGRHEYLLDLSLPEVQKHILQVLDSCLSSGKIRYIKWDMNRPLTDIQTAEKSHRYVLGLYHILDEIASRYPDVIIEGCSSGGCRLDPGILSYVHQNWASDNTDPFDRVSVQSGLSLFLPPQKLTAHVSASPNHQTGRICRMEDRFELTRFFCPGYELDLSGTSEEEMTQLRQQVCTLKEERDWMNQAVFYQQKDCWVKTDLNKDLMHVLVFQDHFEPAKSHRSFRFPFADPEAVYRISPLDTLVSGEQLIRTGIVLPLPDHDFKVVSLRLEKISDFSESA